MCLTITGRSLLAGRALTRPVGRAGRSPTRLHCRASRRWASARLRFRGEPGHDVFLIAAQVGLVEDFIRVLPRPRGRDRDGGGHGPEVSPHRALAGRREHLARRARAAWSVVPHEINPSSNLLIGNLSDLKNHPLWRIKPPVKLDGIGPVAVCIGTDNPITFMTGTREEYQLVYDTMTLAGLSDMEARQWLQEVRESGLESRFTLSEPFDFSDEQMWQNMDVDITHVEMAL